MKEMKKIRKILDKEGCKEGEMRIKVLCGPFCFCVLPLGCLLCCKIKDVKVIVGQEEAREKMSKKG